VLLLPQSQPKAIPVRVQLKTASRFSWEKLGFSLRSQERSHSLNVIFLTVILSVFFSAKLNELGTFANEDIACLQTVTQK